MYNRFTRLTIICMEHSPVDQYCAQLKAELAGMMQPFYRPKMKTHSQ